MSSSIWYAPTAEDVLSEFTPSECATINTLMGGGATVTNHLTRILERSIAEIRGYIRSGAYALDESPNTLPPSMVVDAIAIARWRLLVSAPQLKQLQTDERRDAALASMVKLKDTAAQNYTPEEPSGTPASSAGMWNSENKIIPRIHPIPKPSTQFAPQTDAYANPNAPQDS